MAKSHGKHARLHQLHQMSWKTHAASIMAHGARRASIASMQGHKQHMTQRPHNETCKACECVTRTRAKEWIRRMIIIIICLNQKKTEEHTWLLDAWEGGCWTCGTCGTCSTQETAAFAWRWDRHGTDARSGPTGSKLPVILLRTQDTVALTSLEVTHACLPHLVLPQVSHGRSRSNASLTSPVKIVPLLFKEPQPKLVQNSPQRRRSQTSPWRARCVDGTCYWRQCVMHKYCAAHSVAALSQQRITAAA